MSSKSLEARSDLDISGALMIERHSDGTPLGTVEIDTGQTPPRYNAIRYLQRNGCRAERRETADLDGALRWIAENPHLPDRTMDPDVVRLNRTLMRIVKRVPGDGVIAIPYAESANAGSGNTPTPLVWRAFRDGELCGRLTRSPRDDGWRVVSVQRDWLPADYLTFEDALDDLADAALGRTPSAHERLEREQQKAEDRARRAKPDPNGPDPD